MRDGAQRATLGLHMFVAVLVALGLMTVVSRPATAASPALPGIDASHWNGKPDWSQVQGSGVKFAFLKATEGRAFLDPMYASNKQQLEALALPVGAYHFALPDKSSGDAVAEADWFVSNAGLKGKNLLPVLDLEDSGGLGTRKLKRWVKAWLGEVEASSGVKAMIYTSPSFWTTHMADSRWFADHGYRLWIAHWTAAAQPSVPAANWGGHGWTFWQFDNCGSVDGISGCIDLDRFNGSGVRPVKIKSNR